MYNPLTDMGARPKEPLPSGILYRIRNRGTHAHMGFVEILCLRQSVRTIEEMVPLMWLWSRVYLLHEKMRNRRTPGNFTGPSIAVAFQYLKYVADFPFA